MKRYRYRKIKPEDIELMRKLREQGLSYREIGERFNVNWKTPNYHLNPKEKKRCLEWIKKYNKTLTKEQIREKNKKRKPYTRQYIKERYNNDPEFRRNFLDMVKRNKKKRRKKWIKIGLCPECGKERKDKKYIQCENCRRKKREWATKKDITKNPRK